MILVEQTGQAILSPLLNLWKSFVELIPGLIGAIVVLIVGYLVAWLVGYALHKALHKAKLDQVIMNKTTLDKAMGRLELSNLIGLIVKWYVFVLFLTPAASLIKLVALSDFLILASLWIPSLIAAVLVALVGLIVADYVYAKIHEIKAKSSVVIAEVLKVIIIIFTLIISLSQLGIDVSIAESSFLIILAGIMLAFAIGVGLAIKPEVQPFIKKIKKKL